MSCSHVVMIKAARGHGILISICNKHRHEFGSVLQYVEYWKHGTTCDYGNTELCVITPNVFFHLIFRWEQ